MLRNIGFCQSFHCWPVFLFLKKCLCSKFLLLEIHNFPTFIGSYLNNIDVHYQIYIINCFHFVYLAQIFIFCFTERNFVSMHSSVFFFVNLLCSSQFFTKSFRLREMWHTVMEVLTVRIVENRRFGGTLFIFLIH